MNTLSRSIFVGAALAMLLAGCQKKDAPAVTSHGEPAQTFTNAPPISQTPTRDPSVPAAATVFAAQDAADKAKTQQDTNTLQHQPNPQREMTKEDESKAMPLPGQANDHSAIALDKSKRR